MNLKPEGLGEDRHKRGVTVEAVACKSHNLLLCDSNAERCWEQRIVGRQEAVWLSRPLE